MQLLYGKNIYVSRVDPSNIDGEQVGCNSTKCQNGFIDISQMCLSGSIYFLVKMSVCRMYPGHNCLVEEKQAEFQTHLAATVS